MSDARVVLCTIDDADKAAAMARTLVEEQRCACVNLVPGVRSIYRYAGKLCDDAETLMVIKSTADAIDALKARLVALHPYDVPEFLVLDVEGGHAPYLEWLSSSVRQP